MLSIESSNCIQGNTVIIITFFLNSWLLLCISLYKSKRNHWSTPPSYSADEHSHEHSSAACCMSRIDDRNNPHSHKEMNNNNKDNRSFSCNHKASFIQKRIIAMLSMSNLCVHHQNEEWSFLIYWTKWRFSLQKQ